MSMCAQAPVTGANFCRNRAAVTDPAWAQAGSVTAALFLQKFAPVTGAWAHMDIFAWNPRARPGYPEGAEAQALRACFQYFRTRFA